VQEADCTNMILAATAEWRLQVKKSPSGDVTVVAGGDFVAEAFITQYYGRETSYATYQEWMRILQSPEVKQGDQQKAERHLRHVVCLKKQSLYIDGSEEGTWYEKDRLARSQFSSDGKAYLSKEGMWDRQNTRFPLGALIHVGGPATNCTLVRCNRLVDDTPRLYSPSLRGQPDEPGPPVAENLNYAAWVIARKDIKNGEELRLDPATYLWHGEVPEVPLEVPLRYTLSYVLHQTSMYGINVSL
jgi:hypothetical protein